MFVGTHERQLDDKGRLALPSSFRKHLEATCYLALGDDRCVTLYAPADFEAMVEEMLEQARQGAISQPRLRTVAGSVSEVSIDKQGRITIDERLRTYAHLDTSSKVIVAGRFDRAEIWNEEVHSSVSEAGEGELAETSGLAIAGSRQ